MFESLTKDDNIHIYMKSFLYRVCNLLWSVSFYFESIIFKLISKDLSND